MKDFQKVAQNALMLNLRTGNMVFDMVLSLKVLEL